VRSQRLDEALADADRAVALEPKAWQPHSVRGLALLHAQRPAEAAGAFEKVLAIRADLLPTWRGLAQARRRSGDLVGAHDAIASALKLSPDDGQTHLELGKLLRAENRSDAARVAFEKAIEQNVRVAEALVNLAGLRAELGDLEGALAKLAEARRVEPTLREAWMPAFGFLETLGRTEECLALRTAYLAWNPRELGQRVTLVRSVLMGEAGPLHDELLRKTFAELATLGAEERDDVRLLRAMHAIQRGEQDSAPRSPPARDRIHDREPGATGRSPRTVRETPTLNERALASRGRDRDRLRPATAMRTGPSPSDSPRVAAPLPRRSRGVAASAAVPAPPSACRARGPRP
jgi:tetratricopeptide (TPR) repeat protein